MGMDRVEAGRRAEIMKMFSEHPERVEFRGEIYSDEWISFAANSNKADFDFNRFQYRIKEESKKPEYIPFDKTDDILGLRIKTTNGFGINGFVIRCMITGQKSEGIYIGPVDKIFSYEDLLKDWVKEDGSPCGKLKE